MSSIISVDFYADFGFFKKPDINDTIYLTYNFIHKPAILGIFGAILGFDGNKEEGKLPEYYKKLKDIRIGIEPIGNHKNGNFEKIVIKYNDATGISGSGATLNITEQILIKPAYRIYIEVDAENDIQRELKNKLEKNESTYIPYFGKNEFHCWWDNYRDYFETDNKSKIFNIITIFSKPKGKTLNEFKKALTFGFSLGFKAPIEETFTIFERLPVGYDIKLNQYSELQEFVYTNITFDKSRFPLGDNFKEIRNEGDKGYVAYLF